ncbi:uncharacterized protein STEHIDRAFT_126485 [Stereum hirsutum FP-91666 SS1]|uniref:Uncharacterized protein n=1 Tax=Stereum hirsutum (strain FP-91666) TaxID=721885 RepID=R7RXD5_STEHR|nr:uncharacterized protein STEHIDRAFT_126485 [Stereum hirsutum FP-91666 SS1]EIM79488.1 hypothetical protein STEHIDRAFT_126485 [Stereum hirsutum FP-91666 SS1]
MPTPTPSPEFDPEPEPAKGYPSHSGQTYPRATFHFHCGPPLQNTAPPSPSAPAPPPSPLTTSSPVPSLIFIFLHPLLHSHTRRNLVALSLLSLLIRRLVVSGPCVCGFGANEGNGSRDGRRKGERSGKEAEKRGNGRRVGVER